MSAKLGNNRHEEFCKLVARGIAQGESYRRVYGKKNDSAGSRLVRRHADRITELKAERICQVPAMTEGHTLEEMGVTRTWIAAQFNTVYERALDAEKYADATKALQNLDKMRAEEQDGVSDVDKVPSVNRVDINALGSVLDKFSNILEISKQPGVVMKDVTPTSNDPPTLPAIRAHRQTDQE